MEAIYLLLFAYLGGLVYASVIAVKKGKTTMMVCGWLLFTPLIVIAACRIAKPTSSWARERYHYDPLKAMLSKTRFPKESWIIERLNERPTDTAISLTEEHNLRTKL